MLKWPACYKQAAVATPTDSRQRFTYATPCCWEMTQASFFHSERKTPPEDLPLQASGYESELEGEGTRHWGRGGGGERWGRREERPGARCNKKQLTCPLKILNFLTACDHILCRAWAVFIVAGYNLLGDVVHPGLFICFYHSTRLCNSNTIVAYILKQILLPVSHRNTSKTQQGNLLGVSLTLTLRGPGKTQDHILMFKNNKTHYYFKCQEQINM